MFSRRKSLRRSETLITAVEPKNDDKQWDVKAVVRECRAHAPCDMKIYNMTDDGETCLYHYAIDVDGLETHEFRVPFSRTAVRMHTKSKDMDEEEFTKQTFVWFTIDNCMRHQFENIRYTDGQAQNRLSMYLTCNSDKSTTTGFLSHIMLVTEDLNRLFANVAIQIFDKHYEINL